MNLIQYQLYDLIPKVLDGFCSAKDPKTLLKQINDTLCDKCGLKTIRHFTGGAFLSPRDGDWGCHAWRALPLSMIEIDSDDIYSTRTFFIEDAEGTKYSWMLCAQIDSPRTQMCLPRLFSFYKDLEILLKEQGLL